MAKSKIFAAAAALLLFALQPVMAEVDCGFWFDVPESITNSDIEGVRFGLPFSASNAEVEGAELSLFYSGTHHVEGLKFTLFGVNYSETLHGAELAFLNMTKRDLSGLQWGFINHSGADGIQIGFVNNCDNDALFQLGLININKNGWLPVMIFFNFGSDLFD